MAVFIILTAITFSLFGFIIGILAQNWEKLSIIPTLLVTPLVFLGGSFYSIDMLPEFWQKVSLLNPVFYLISGFRWSFFGTSEIPIALSIVAILSFMAICLLIIAITLFILHYQLSKLFFVYTLPYNLILWLSIHINNPMFFTYICPSQTTVICWHYFIIKYTIT